MCKHESSRFGQVICSNGSIQIRKVCIACGENVRGRGINVPHFEALRIGLDIPALLILADNRRRKQDAAQNASAEQGLLF